MSDVTVRAAGVVTGWGRGLAALPTDPRAAAAGRRVVQATPTPRTGDRLRRVTRECLLAIDAVDAMLDDGRVARSEIAGDGTALVYVTAAAYGASNRAFVEGGGGALHFPYTAPSAVPAEVAIEFGLHGPYVVFIGGAATTVDALGHARTLLHRGACARAVVLGVETFAECADLHARLRWLTRGPLVEAAVAVLLEPRGEGPGAARTMAETATGERMIGETLACGPLIALAAACAVARDNDVGTRGDVVSADADVEVRGRWRGRETALTLNLDRP